MEDLAGRFGKYQLVRRLGSGGMAEVWLAREALPGALPRSVVVKRILPSLASETDLVQLFASEARLSARLDHPNIVRVYESGQLGDQCYLTMEYIRGRDLRTLGREGGVAGPGDRRKSGPAEGFGPEKVPSV